MILADLIRLVQQAADFRTAWIDDQHCSAFRLFNGFVEGFPELAIDVFGRTLVIYNFADPPSKIQDLLKPFCNSLHELFSWTQTILVKTRFSSDLAERRGLIYIGTKLDDRICEHGIWYAIDLQINSDSSLYLDTRNLRRWLMQHAQDRRVLNTFAYTGSLGVAAQAGGASQVIHLDKSRKFLNLAKRSYGFNGFPISRANFVCEDFFRSTSQLRRMEQSFDMVILDPPFFSITPAGKVDLTTQYNRLANKVRPLVKEGGHLVAINNAIFVSGQDYLRQLENLCQDGYLEIEELIPVPPDFTGFSAMRLAPLPADPTPFNHSTKIAILKILKKK